MAEPAAAAPVEAVPAAPAEAGPKTAAAADRDFPARVVMLRAEEPAQTVQAAKQTVQELPPEPGQRIAV